MNERMTDLLDHASDDGGAPLGFSGAGIARRALARRRRRYGVAAAGLAAASVVGIVVAGQLLSSPDAGSLGPAVGPTGTTATPASPSASAGPTLTREQQAVVDACTHAHLPARAVRAPSGSNGLHSPQIGQKIQDTSSGGARATFLRDWTLDAYLKDDLGLTATFVNPDHTRWASCDVASGGTQDAGGVNQGPLPAGPVPQSWYGPDGFRHQATSPAWSQVCTAGEGKVCAHELFAGAFALYDGVTAVRVDAPDGTVLHPVLGTYTYVFRHAELRVDAHRAANDSQPLPSMPVTLLDGHGDTIIRYDYYPSYIVPSSCPATGGC